MRAHGGRQEQGQDSTNEEPSCQAAAQPLVHARCLTAAAGALTQAAALAVALFAALAVALAASCSAAALPVQLTGCLAA